MKKLTLSLETLAVQSFETADGERESGTVQAYSDPISAWRPCLRTLQTACLSCYLEPTCPNC